MPTLPPIARVLPFVRDRSGEPFVWHFAMVRAGAPASSGERLATWVLPPELVAKVEPAALDRALELERQRWHQLVIANGYADGWTVQLVRERGFRRSVFPAAAIAGLTTGGRELLTTPKGGPIS